MRAGCARKRPGRDERVGALPSPFRILIKCSHLRLNASSCVGVWQDFSLRLERALCPGRAVGYVRNDKRNDKWSILSVLEKGVA